MKLKTLKKIIGGYKPASQQLIIKAEKYAKKSAYQVEFILILASQKIIASEDDHTISEAVDLALDKLLRQVKKYFSKLKNHRKK